MLTLIWNALNAQFTSSLLGALAGALAGAYAAQRIADKNRDVQELLSQIRAVNLIISHAYDIFNVYTGLMSQHVSGLKNNYSDVLKEFNASKATVLAMSHASTKTKFKCNLAFLHSPENQACTLRVLALEKISLPGRPSSLISALIRTTAAIENTIQIRNDWIRQTKLMFHSDPDLAILHFLGIEYGPGHIDRTYAESIESIHSQCNDVIYFSYLLCKDVTKYGNLLASELKNLSKKKLPIIREVDFTKAHEQGIIPSSSDYPTWDSAFKTAVA